MDSNAGLLTITYLVKGGVQWNKTKKNMKRTKYKEKLSTPEKGRHGCIQKKILKSK